MGEDMSTTRCSSVSLDCLLGIMGIGKWQCLIAGDPRDVHPLVVSNYFPCFCVSFTASLRPTWSTARETLAANGNRIEIRRLTSTEKGEARQVGCPMSRSQAEPSPRTTEAGTRTGSDRKCRGRFLIAFLGLTLGVVV
jgi:hypothetical protein